MSVVGEILTFWFGDPLRDDTSYQARRKIWFRKSSAFDEQVRTRFQSVYESAVAGTFDAWQALPEGSLALAIALDQFPRHLFRHQPQAFATDDKALCVAQGAIAKSFDLALPPIQRLFLYLPLEHSEDLAVQRQSVAKFQQLVAIAPEFSDALDYAVRHHAVISRFGRFPHRNEALDRVNTADEAEFLKQPGSSF